MRKRPQKPKPARPTVILADVTAVDTGAKTITVQLESDPTVTHTVPAVLGSYPAVGARVVMLMNGDDAIVFAQVETEGTPGGVLTPTSACRLFWGGGAAETSPIVTSDINGIRFPDDTSTAAYNGMTVEVGGGNAFIIPPTPDGNGMFYVAHSVMLQGPYTAAPGDIIRYSTIGDVWSGLDIPLRDLGADEFQFVNACGFQFISGGSLSANLAAPLVASAITVVFQSFAAAQVPGVVI